MIHRDLNPTNLMLVPGHRPGQLDTTKDATVKILEIALGRALFDEGDAAAGPHDANLTTAGDLLGSPDYISPEQARDAHRADIRSDIYALGCVLFHTLTGQVPFPDKNIATKMVKAATTAPPRLASLRPGIPDGLQVILDRLMARDPAQRYPTPDQAAQALQAYLTAGATPARPIEAEAGMPEYLKYVQSQQPIVDVELVAVPTPVAPPPVPVASPSIPVAKPVTPAVPPASDGLERIFGLTVREWTLIGGAAAVIVILAVVIFFTLRGM